MLASNIKLDNLKWFKTDEVDMEKISDACGVHIKHFNDTLLLYLRKSSL